MASIAHLGTDDSRSGIPKGDRPAAQAELTDLVRGLCGLADVADRFPSALPQVERGFRELAGLATGCGETRVRRIALAFASILGKAHRAPEDDIPFILDTAAAYLEALPGKLGRARQGGLT